MHLQLDVCQSDFPCRKTQREEEKNAHTITKQEEEGKDSKHTYIYESNLFVGKAIDRNTFHFVEHLKNELVATYVETCLHFALYTAIGGRSAPYTLPLPLTLTK